MLMWCHCNYVCSCNHSDIIWESRRLKSLATQCLLNGLSRITSETTSQLTCIAYDDVIIGAIASQITSLTIFYSTDYSGTDQSKHQSSASLAFVWGIHRGPVNSPHKWPVTRKIFPFDDVIMLLALCEGIHASPVISPHEGHVMGTYYGVIRHQCCSTEISSGQPRFG